MLDYRRILLLGVTRIQSVFADTLGSPPRVGIGTGFWMRLPSGGICFITNRHNLDPSLKFPDERDLHLETAKIELRRSYGMDKEEPSYDFETRFFELAEKESKIIVPDDADCAVVVPTFSESTEGFSICAPFEEADLADEDFFRKALMPAHEVYFVGFAGRGADPGLKRGATPWWDTKWNLPIARSAVIASMPFFQFNNDAIKTKDVLLVSGMSFSGSSGSPVMSREVGFRTEPPKNGKGITVQCHGYTPEKLIGIMSGHWRSEVQPPDVFEHSGLSYLTRSTSILHLIRSNAL